MGAAPNGTGYLPWTPLGIVLSAYNASVKPPEGELFVVSVRATSPNGLSALAFSNGVRVLPAADDATGARSGGGAPLACLAATTEATAGMDADALFKEVPLWV